MDAFPNRVTKMKIEPARYAAFVLLNALVIFPMLAFFLSNPGDTRSPGLLGLVFGAALLVMVGQYPLLLRFRSWWKWLLIFYLSMVAFLALTGLGLAWNEPVGSNPAGSLLARLDGALRAAFLGQFVGIWLLPVVYLVNLGMARFTFGPKDSGSA